MEKVPIPKVKRLFDIIMSVIVTVAISPLLIVLIVLFLIEEILITSSRGPLFYKEIRISHGEPFPLWKMRTFKMTAINNARKIGMIHTKELERDRTNLTYTGRLMRQIYMDEAPQIFSVFVGDMSFVGPRPTNPENYERDIKKGLFAKQILRAGLTGRFQTHKHKKYGLNQEIVDLEYADLCATKSGIRILLTDLKILLQTAITVLRAEGL